MVGISRYKKVRRLVAIIGLLTPICLYAAPAAAETTPSAGSNKVAPLSTETPVQRLAKQKAAFPTKLTVAQQAKLKTVCKPAQAKVATLVSGTKPKLERRSSRFKEVQVKLRNLTDKLAKTDYDLTTLQSQQATLKDLVAVYETSQAAYQTALSDLKDVDCVTDPAGFDALLSAARSARTQVLLDSGAVRDFIRTKIGPTLQEAKLTLAQSKNTKEQN